MKLLVVISVCILAVESVPQYPVFGYAPQYPRFSKTSEIQPMIVPPPSPSANAPNPEDIPIISISDLINAAEGEGEQPQGEQYLEQYLCLNVIQLPPKLFGNRQHHNKRPRIGPGIPGAPARWFDGRQLATDQTSLQFMCANIVTASQISDILDAIKKPSLPSPPGPTTTLPTVESSTETPDGLSKQAAVTTDSPSAETTTEYTGPRKFPTPYPLAPGKESVEKESVEVAVVDEKISPFVRDQIPEHPISPLLHPGLLHPANRGYPGHPGHPGHPGLYPQHPYPLQHQRTGYINYPMPIYPGYNGPYH